MLYNKAMCLQPYRVTPPPHTVDAMCLHRLHTPPGRPNQGHRSPTKSPCRRVRCGRGVRCCMMCGATRESGSDMSNCWVYVQKHVTLSISPSLLLDLVELLDAQAAGPVLRPHPVEQVGLRRDPVHHIVVGLWAGPCRTT